MGKLVCTTGGNWTCRDETTAGDAFVISVDCFSDVSTASKQASFFSMDWAIYQCLERKAKEQVKVWERKINHPLQEIKYTKCNGMHIAWFGLNREIYPVYHGMHISIDMHPPPQAPYVSLGMLLSAVNAKTFIVDTWETMSHVTHSFCHTTLLLFLYRFSLLS